MKVCLLDRSMPAKGRPCMTGHEVMLPQNFLTAIAQHACMPYEWDDTSLGHAVWLAGTLFMLKLLALHIDSSAVKCCQLCCKASRFCKVCNSGLTPFQRQLDNAIHWRHRQGRIYPGTFSEGARHGRGVHMHLCSGVNQA